MAHMYQCVFCTTVLTEGGQVRGGDQGPHRQTERGEILPSLYPEFRVIVSFRAASHELHPQSVPAPQAETRAEFAERSVAKLEKTIDDLEGMTSL